MIGSSFILGTKSSDWKAAIFREHWHRSMRRCRRLHILHPYLSSGECDHVFWTWGSLFTRIKGKHMMQTFRVGVLCGSDFIAHHQLVTSSQGYLCPALLAKHSKDR